MRVCVVHVVDDMADFISHSFAMVHKTRVRDILKAKLAGVYVRVSAPVFQCWTIQGLA